MKGPGPDQPQSSCVLTAPAGLCAGASDGAGVDPWTQREVSRPQRDRAPRRKRGWSLTCREVHCETRSGMPQVTQLSFDNVSLVSTSACGQRDHVRIPDGGHPPPLRKSESDGMTTGGPTHEKSRQRKRAVCGYVRPRPQRRRCAQALSFSTVTPLPAISSLHWVVVYARRRNPRHSLQPCPGSTRLTWRLHDGPLPFHDAQSASEEAEESW